MSASRKTRLTLAALETLIEELGGVRSILPNAFGQYIDEADDDSYIEAGHIESAEVEVALSSVISTLTAKCKLSEEPESFSQLFEELFSPDDETVGLAINLEDAVNGYFGELFGEDLNLADDYLIDLIAVLTERRDKWKAIIASQKRLNLE